MKYIDEATSKYNFNDKCIIISIMAIESCGDKEMKWNSGSEKVSYGIMQISKKTYSELIQKHAVDLKKIFPGKSLDNEHLEENLGDVKFSIYLAVLYLKDYEDYVERKVEEYDYQNLGFKSKDDERVAFYGAVYNGGSDALSQSRDCSSDRCKEIKFKVPKVMCAYNPGGLVETQKYIVTMLRLYSLCKK